MIKAKQLSLFDHQFGLLNGVTLLANGHLVVVDGAFEKNCIYVLDDCGNVLRSVGGLGFGRTTMKEPVGVFASPNSDLYIADWHNHRVLVLKEDLTYAFEIGTPAFTALASTSSRARSFANLAKQLLYTGSYIRLHFPADGVLTRNSPHDRSISVGLTGAAHWLRTHGLIGSYRTLLYPSVPMNKPNGVAFLPNRLAVCNKNLRNILILDEAQGYGIEKTLTAAGDTEFGRLGNIMYCGNHLYVCDESKSSIWMFDRDLAFCGRLVGTDSGVGAFAPFSICRLTDNYIATCGGRNFQIFDIRTRQHVYCSADYGELHGVSFDHRTGILHVADRGAGMILSFSLELEGTK